MQLVRASRDDLPFLFECLIELRGQASYEFGAFREYVERCGLLAHPDFQLWVAREDSECVGMLTCNRFAVPRYLGFGYEIEEVVVHPRHQRRGVGREMIAAFLQRAATDRAIRKVLVKTDDAMRAGKIYRRFFTMVETTLYGKVIHRL